ncbi:uncharacterized protein LOC135313081 [Phalacrocorax carbo]|uniref:uncharacterized protein LOC135313081 n=1 Tax=Phalacrocorax carbo TaxID=9209 RepID=UPI00311911A9
MNRLRGLEGTARWLHRHPIPRGFPAEGIRLGDAGEQVQHAATSHPRRHVPAQPRPPKRGSVAQCPALYRSPAYRRRRRPRTLFHVLSACRARPRSEGPARKAAAPAARHTMGTHLAVGTCHGDPPHHGHPPCRGGVPWGPATPWAPTLPWGRAMGTRHTMGTHLAVGAWHSVAGLAWRAAAGCGGKSSGKAAVPVVLLAWLVLPEVVQKSGQAVKMEIRKQGLGSWGNI